MVEDRDRKERLLYLLADQALTGLSPEEQLELRRLVAEFPELSDDSFELTAAAVDLAFSREAVEPLPEQVQRTVLQASDAWLARQRPVSGADRTTAQRPPSPSFVQWAGWLAAAACLVLAVAGWWPRQSPPREPTLEQQLQQLLARADDVQTAEWQTTEDPLVTDRPITGDVVWSKQRQQGFMRFRGLPPNDRSRNQYQLWIFDDNQDERYPIDGGVFDVTDDRSQVIVAIDPKLHVVSPTLFAVTLEKPGGVVVSSRERLLALAKVAG